MERILYKFNLDVTKPDAQKCLTGFSIGETETRRLLITLMNGRNPLELDGTENISMFVMKPSDTTPSIGGCTIDGSTITYDVLQSDVSEEGIVQMTLKIQHLTEEGDISITYAAHFVLQVTDPNCDESHIPSDPTYSYLEQLVGELEELNGDAEAWAVGTRDGEPVPDTDPAYENNAKYWAGIAAESVIGNIEESEAWAVGTRSGVPVTEGDETYHNNSKYYAEQADTSATTAVTKAGEAADSASTASTASAAAVAKAGEAADSATAASGSASTATTKAGEASASATTAGNAATTATTKAGEASTSAANAALSESNASASATTASNAALSAGVDALISEGYANGKQNGTPVGSGEYYQNNSKYFSELAAEIVASLLEAYGVNVVGTKLIFGTEFEEHFNIAVVGTQLQITNI